MVAMPPALAHTRKMMRNIASRPFSTPNRNIMGRVMSRMHTATHTDSRMTGLSLIHIYKGAGRGEEKKQYVIDFLKQKGFKVDEESVSNAIEAAVKQLNTEGLTIE